MKLFSTTLRILGLTTALATAQGRLQIGVGGGTYTGSEYDEEWGYGLSGEIGVLFDDQPVNLFLGVRGAYIDGLSASEKSGGILDASESDLDLFEGALVARLLFPLGNDHIKLYGEGGLGAANVGITGDARGKANIGGKDFSFNSRFDENSWVFSWSLGAGVQFDLTENMGLRLGYGYRGLGDSEVFGLKADQGNVHGAEASVVIKF